MKATGWIHTSRGFPAEGDRVIVHNLLPYFAWYYGGEFFLALGDAIGGKPDPLKLVEWWMPFNCPPPEWFKASCGINTLEKQLPEVAK